MTIFATVLHVMVCLILIVVVLLQRGKGAEIGAVFGGGASSTVFGSRGAGNFLTKLTSGAAVVFMLTSLYLSYQGSKQFEEHPRRGIEEAGRRGKVEVCGAAEGARFRGEADATRGSRGKAARAGESVARAPRAFRRPRPLGMLGPLQA